MSRRHKSRTAQLRHYTSHPGYHVPTPLPSSTTYILTVSSSGRPLRQIISSSRALRAEVERQQQQDGMLVIKGREGWRMAEAVGVEGRVLEEEGLGGCVGEGGWWDDVAGRVGLCLGGRMPVMVVDEGSSISKTGLRPPEATRHTPGTSRPGQGSGSRRGKWCIDGLEERLAQEMVTAADLPDLLGAITYERWTDFLLAAGAHVGRQDWSRILRSLEKNAEMARRRRLSAQRVTYTHWTDLVTRTTLRHVLLLLSNTRSSSPSPSQEEQEEERRKSPNERSLDRVTYLGGLLLPMTVVSSILAIEGPYGPTGPSFWVFWVASGISSLAAVAVIYVDQMRRVDVWVEAVVAGADDGVVSGLAEAGRERRMWRRGELGWKGAVKRVSGLERWWPSEGVRFQRPAVMERVVMDV